MISKWIKLKPDSLAAVLARTGIAAGLFVTGAVAAVEIEHPGRTIGYFIGDVLVQKITLNADEGRITGEDLKSGQRIDEYLYRLPVNQPPELSWAGVQLQSIQRIRSAISEGIAGAELVAELRYQVINVPPVTQTISLPESTLVTDAGINIKIPRWQFNIGPLLRGAERSTADSESAIVARDDVVGGEQQLLPDRSAIELLGTTSLHKYKARLVALFALLCGTVLLWIAWWLYRQFKDRRVLPFAKARYHIGKLPAPKRRSDDVAWRSLHAAFNETAGRTIGSGSVSDLLQRAPWLKLLGDEIENFYRASAERFFQQSDSARDVNIESFAQTLYLLEKQQSPSSLVNHAAVQSAIAETVSAESASPGKTVTSQSKSLVD